MKKPLPMFGLVVGLALLMGLPVLIWTAIFAVAALHGIAIFLPCALLYAAIAWIAYRLAGGNGPVAAAAALAAVALLAAVPPLLINRAADARAASWIREDEVPGAIARKPGAVALLTPERKHARNEEVLESDCANLCQRLLYGGGVEAVLAGAVAEGQALDPRRRLARYRIDRRPVCPETFLPAAWAIEGEQSVAGSSPVSDAVSGRIADGECLVRDEAPLGSADIVWQTGSLDAGGDAFPVKALGAPNVSRSSLFEKSGGKWTRIGQATRFEGSRASIPFVFSLDWLHEDRSRIAVRSRPFILGTPADDRIARTALRPWLAQPRPIAPELLRTRLDSMFRTPGSPGVESAAPSPRERLAWAFIDELADKGIYRPGDDRLLTRIVADPGFLPQRHARDAFPALPRAMATVNGDGSAIGKAMLKRILAADPFQDQALISALAGAVPSLPTGSFSPLPDELRRLAADKRRRGLAGPALLVMAEGGPGALEDLLAIAEASVNRDPRRDTVPSEGAELTSIARAICGAAPGGGRHAPRIASLYGRLPERERRPGREAGESLLLALTAMDAKADLAALGVTPQERDRLRRRMETLKDRRRVFC